MKLRTERVDAGMVAKNAWWYADCPKHGKQPHLAVLGGRCEKCAAEALEKEKEKK